MDGNSAGSAGLVANDGGRADDHQARHRCGTLDRATDQILAACIVLAYSNTQESQKAQEHLLHAQSLLLELLAQEARSAREGQQGREGVHGEDPKDAQVSRITLDPANDDIYDPRN